MKDPRRGNRVILVMSAVAILIITFSGFIVSTSVPKVWQNIAILITCLGDFVLCAISAIWQDARTRKYTMHLIEENIYEAKSRITPEFQQVFMNDYYPFLPEMYECQAKIDDGGKIVCKIHLDSEITMDYEEFIEYFEFPDNE